MDKAKEKDTAAAQQQREKNIRREVGGYNRDRHARLSRRCGKNWRGSK